MIFNLYKQRGETPLECIQRFSKTIPELKGEKMTYLGRLDPLAEGVLLMASGEDMKRKEEFLELDKVYDFVSIFGFATDTYDILGKILRVEKLKELSESEIRKVIAVYEGERDQKYPLYSSKMIDKKKLVPKKSKKTSPLASRGPLLIQEREGTKSKSGSFPSPEQGKGEGGVPSKKITVYKMQFHTLETLNCKELFGRLLMDISRVNGNFRQHEILVLWKEMLLGKNNDWQNPNFLGKFTAHVSSGTYIRGIVNDMGNTLGFGATTLSIKRTRVGDYLIEDSIK